MDHSPLVKLVDTRMADAHAQMSGKTLEQSWWYLTLRALASSDPTLRIQLDVGPNPGQWQDIDRTVPRFGNVFAVFADIPEKPYRGIAGFFPPGRVLDRALLFASIVTQSQQFKAQDVALLANVYDQLSTYVFDTLGFRGVQVYCTPNSLHSEALAQAEYERNAVLIKAARGVKRSWTDVEVYTKG